MSAVPGLLYFCLVCPLMFCLVAARFLLMLVHTVFYPGVGGNDSGVAFVIVNEE